MSGKGRCADKRIERTVAYLLRCCRAHITPIDADDPWQYALDEIDGGEAKAEAHQEELPSDATTNR